MKKIKLHGKLSLNKETIARLNDEQMNNVKGGANWDWDWPTFGDKCFDGGGTTFKDACEWCGFLHSTDHHLGVSPAPANIASPVRYSPKG
jgi:natural product precursor